MEEVLGNNYVFWLVTGAIGLLGGAVIFFLKRGLDKFDKRLAKLEDHMHGVEDKLNETIANMPFIYTTREDFIRITASHDRKLDQIIALLTSNSQKGGN